MFVFTAKGKYEEPCWIPIQEWLYLYLNPNSELIWSLWSLSFIISILKQLEARDIRDRYLGLAAGEVKMHFNDFTAGVGCDKRCPKWLQMYLLYVLTQDDLLSLSCSSLANVKLS